MAVVLSNLCWDALLQSKNYTQKKAQTKCVRDYLTCIMQHA